MNTNGLLDTYFDDIVSNKREQHLVDLRRIIVAYYSMKGISTVYLGKLLGRDHSTICYLRKTHHFMYQNYVLYKGLADKVFEYLDQNSNNFLQRLEKHYYSRKSK